MVVTVPPLVRRSDQKLPGRWQTFRFMEQSPEPGSAVLARHGQPTNGVVQADDLTGEKFTVPIERLSNSTCVVHRPYNDARCLLRTSAWPTLSFGLQFHTEWNARNPAAGKRLKNAAIYTTAVTCDAVRMSNILDTAEIMFCSRDAKSASRDDIQGMFPSDRIIAQVVSSLSYRVPTRSRTIRPISVKR